MKNLLFFLVLFFLTNFCFAQSKGVTPMHKFFQQYADSTIFIEYSTEGYDPPKYKVLTKTDDFANTFVYEAIDTTWYKISSIRKSTPIIFWNMLANKKILFKNLPADINIFFNIVPLPPDTTKKMWQEISKFTPWKLLDDKSYPECSAVIMDGGHSIMHLITKTEIKTLVYYAPYYYEEQCPGNKNRQGITGIERLFDRYITFKNQR
ncbi:hypothetical protein [Pedobacter sandarakinus]|uniref:hypothetical protein n=1 Tax=Pedobacter sandarakinus TaxID=353156 RepID=UPI00224735FF|nr:hypothetical protein [Pedobacter sandarakinus]MCX2573885.1 hypothetical protein [Pedobacter sandarakinus]